MEEYYLPSQQYPKYEVSNFGNVRNIRSGTVRKQTDRKGYRKIRINNKDVSIHRLVAETFLEQEHDGLQVNHKDGNKANNRVDNLEWVEASENVKHAYRTGLKQHSGGTPPIQILDEDSGKIYESAAECAREIDGTRPGILYALEHGGTYKGHRFRKYEGD